MIMDDYDGQIIFGDRGGLKLPDICLTDEEKPRKNLTPETCPDRGSNPGPLRDRRACYRLSHSKKRFTNTFIQFEFFGDFYFRATLEVKEVLQSSKNSTSIF